MPERRTSLPRSRKSGPEDDYSTPKVKVLSEMIKHHVKEEEQRDGMFAKARKSDMDLDDLARRMKARKSELELNGDTAASRYFHTTGPLLDA